MIHNGHDSSENEPKENRTAVALDVALESAKSPRVRKLIRRALQYQVVENNSERFRCHDCEELVDADERREYLPAGDDRDRGADVETLSLCLECSTRRPSVRIFKPEGSQ